MRLSMKTRVVCAAIAFAPLVAWGQSAVTLDAPRAGWNQRGLVDRSDETAVAYPPALIDRGTQRRRTLIRGAVLPPRTDTPSTLIVNGNPMPLYTGEGGRFARPYALAPGSNSVEVRAPDGSARRRVQVYEANRDAPRAQLRIVLGWDDSQAEVDLHVITPDGQHAFWARPVLSDGGGLDVDSVDGPGPEMFSMTAPPRGAYHVYVNYWGNFGAGGYHFDESTRERDVVTATVTFVFQENTAAERRETFRVPLRKIGDLGLVKSFVF
ncbi:MAG: DUF2135 domain-containing protein [Betaproteobacteria bacterium]